MRKIAYHRLVSVRKRFQTLHTFCFHQNGIWESTSTRAGQSSPPLNCVSGCQDPPICRAQILYPYVSDVSGHVFILAIGTSW